MTMPQVIVQKGKHKNRVASAIQSKIKEDKDKKLFRLTMADLPNREE